MSARIERRPRPRLLMLIGVCELDGTPSDADGDEAAPSCDVAGAAGAADCARAGAASAAAGAIAVGLGAGGAGRCVIANCSW